MILPTKPKSKMKIKTYSKCSIEAAKKALVKEIKAAQSAETGYPQKDIEVDLDIEISEGPEDCGYGTLEITGSATVILSKSYTDPRLALPQWESRTVRVGLENNGSRWENYGAPSGTRYSLDLIAE